MLAAIHFCIGLRAAFQIDFRQENSAFSRRHRKNEAERKPKHLITNTHSIKSMRKETISNYLKWFWYIVAFALMCVVVTLVGALVKSAAGSNIKNPQTQSRPVSTESTPENRIQMVSSSESWSLFDFQGLSLLSPYDYQEGPSILERLPDAVQATIVNYRVFQNSPESNLRVFITSAEYKPNIVPNLEGAVTGYINGIAGSVGDIQPEFDSRPIDISGHEARRVSYTSVAGGKPIYMNALMVRIGQRIWSIQIEYRSEQMKAIAGQILDSATFKSPSPKSSQGLSEFSWQGLRWGMTPEQVAKIVPFKPIELPVEWYLSEKQRFTKGYIDRLIDVNGTQCRAFLLFRGDDSLRGIVLLALKDKNVSIGDVLSEKYEAYWDPEEGEFRLPDTGIKVKGYYYDFMNIGTKSKTTGIEYRSLEADPNPL